MRWKRTQAGHHTQFAAIDLKYRVLVRKIEWTRPGAFRRTIQQNGWAVFVDGQQTGLAHTTAKKAREWAEQPGVLAELRQALGLTEGD